MNEWKSERRLLIFLKLPYYPSLLRVCRSHLPFLCFAGNCSSLFAAWEAWCKDVLSCIFCFVSANPAACDLQRRRLGRAAARWAGGARALARLAQPGRVGCGDAQAARAACLSTGWRNRLRVLVCRSCWLPSGRHKTWSHFGVQMWHRACSPGESIAWVHWGSWIFETVSVLHF